MGNFSISQVKNISVLALVISGLACNYAYSSAPSSVSLDKDAKLRKEAIITFTKMSPDEPFSRPVAYVVTPSTIGTTAAERDRWKELFAWARAKGGGEKAVEALEKIIEAQHKSKSPAQIFMKKVLATLFAFARGVELNEQHLPSGKVKVTHIDPCSCCNLGRYHIDLVDKPNTMECNIFPISPASNIFSSKITASKEIVREELAQWLFTKKIEKSDVLIAENALRKCALDIFHEVTHLARLDSRIIEPVLGATSIEIPIRHIMEFQADLIPLLMLQDDDYFYARADFFSSLILVNHIECVVLRSKYFPESEESIKALYEAAFCESNPAQQKTLAYLYHLYIIDPHGYSAYHRKRLTEQSYVLLSKTHPRHHVRLQKILTMWAAYLIYEKSFEPKESIDYIQDLLVSTIYCWKVPEKYQDRRELLKIVIQEWANDARAQQRSVATSSSDSSSSSSNRTSSSKKRKQPAG